MGEDRPVRSRASSFGDVGVAGGSCGDVRSRLSTWVAAASTVRGGGGMCFSFAGTGRIVCDWASVRSRVSSSELGAFVLFSRGEVRRARVAAAFVFCFSLLESFDEEEEREALDDIEFSGGLACVGLAGASSGDENVTSRVSIRSEERRSCVGVGIAASSNIFAVFRNFVGV